MLTLVPSWTFKAQQLILNDFAKLLNIWNNCLSVTCEFSIF